MAQKKTTKTTKSNELSTTNVTWMDTLDWEAYTLRPDVGAWKERLAFTMKKWSENNMHFTVEEFCKNYKIGRCRLMQMAKQYEVIGEAYEEMKQYLADNRERFAIKHDPNNVYRSIETLDKKWEEIEDRKAARANKSQESKQPITIVLKEPDTITAEQMKEEQDKIFKKGN